MIHNIFSIEKWLKQTIDIPWSNKELYDLYSQTHNKDEPNMSFSFHCHMTYIYNNDMHKNLKLTQESCSVHENKFKRLSDQSLNPA